MHQQRGIGGTSTKKLSLPQERVTSGVRVFMKRDYNPLKDPSHKLAPIPKGPYLATEADENTCLIKKDRNITERVNMDRVILAR